MVKTRLICELRKLIAYCSLALGAACSGKGTQASDAAAGMPGAAGADTCADSPRDKGVCPVTNPCTGCALTCLETQDILETSCARCHNGENAPGSPLNFILDGRRLSTATSPYSHTPYLVPGDPDHSPVYLRAVGTGEALHPPEPAIVPRVTISGISVLRQWISSCLGPARVMDATGGSGNGGNEAGGGGG